MALFSIKIWRNFQLVTTPGCPLSGIAQGLAKENTAAKRG